MPVRKLSRTRFEKGLGCPFAHHKYSSAFKSGVSKRRHWARAGWDRNLHLAFLLVREKEEVERPGREKDCDADPNVRAEGDCPRW